MNIPALITGLGIGGVAIALAGKETLENFIAAFTILSDKPFQVGESIKIGDLEGMVERIGFRSTRIRGVDGAEIIFPNQKLMSQNLINLTNRTSQIIKLFFSIRYDTPADKLHELVEALSNKITDNQLVEARPDIYVDTQKFESIVIRIDVKFPFPLPENGDIVVVKREMIVALYAVVSAYAHPGGDVHLLNS